MRELLELCGFDDRKRQIRAAPHGGGLRETGSSPSGTSRLPRIGSIFYYDMQLSGVGG